MSATQKMVDYAKGIADLLNLDYPDFSNFNETSAFISEYSPAYKKERYKLVNNATITSICEKDIKLNDVFVNSCLNRSQVAGVYIFWKDDKIMYVGKSIDLSQRILSSFEERRESGINYCSIINCPIVADAHILEVVLITELKPPLNKNCMCDDTSETFFSDLDIEFLKSLRVSIYGGN